MRRVDAQVLGLGYVGLPLAVLLARSGLLVRGVDIDAGARERAASGAALAGEPGFPPLLRAALDAGALEVAAAPGPADATVIAVPTPARAAAGGAKAADLGAVLAAARAAAPALAPGDLVILTSTSPVGTTEAVAAEVARLRGPGHGALFAYAPERVVPGDSLREMRANDRLIGGLTPEAGARAAALLSRFVTGAVSLADARTAEMVKLAENASRDVAIAFANELAGLAEAHGLDPHRVIAEANRHPRVAILRPGVGVGGHCIPVDPWFLQDGAAPTPLLAAARAVNDARPAAVAARLLALVPEGASIACLGLSYKPDVDDFRESPAIEVARRLAAARPGRVACHDPGLSGAAPEGLVPVGLEAALAADRAVILVAHAAYRGLAEAHPGRVIDAASRALPAPEAQRAAGRAALRALG